MNLNAGDNKCQILVDGGCDTILYGKGWKFVALPECLDNVQGNIDDLPSLSLYILGLSLQLLICLMKPSLLRLTKRLLFKII